MGYYEQVAKKAKACQAEQKATILAIESSCDETACAIIQDGRTILSNVIYSQIMIHKEYGGVVPEIASRNHVEKIGTIVQQAMQEANCDWDAIDAIAVTSGPGLIGCLLVGLSYAKALSLARELPLISVHHIKGHICANYLASPSLQPPFLCLVVSGGHSHLVDVRLDGTMHVMGRTRDDAAGEAFDKVARALGLPYPGGPELEKLALTGDPYAFDWPKGFNSGDHFDFSFSGLKTAVINLLHKNKQNGQETNRADIAASFQKAVVDVLVAKAMRACEACGYDTIALAGGVASNSLLRTGMEQEANKRGFIFYCPPRSLCTDNASMIGCAGFEELMRGNVADLSLNARANWPIDQA